MCDLCVLRQHIHSHGGFLFYYYYYLGVLGNIFVTRLSQESGLAFDSMVHTSQELAALLLLFIVIIFNPLLSTHEHLYMTLFNVSVSHWGLCICLRDHVFTLFIFAVLNIYY